MSREVIEKWVNALESGDYQQGTGTLEKHGTYCCLGVLCDLAVKEGITEREVIKQEDKEDIDFEEDVLTEDVAYGGWTTELPTEVVRWAGLDCHNPDLAEDEEIGSISCITANDTLGWSFAQIAEKLREKHLG